MRRDMIINKARKIRENYRIMSVLAVLYNSYVLKLGCQ